MLETNPGSFISLESENDQFTRLYVAYAACLEGFCTACRHLIFFDGNFLKDRYKGTFLAAIAYDEKMDYSHWLFTCMTLKMRTEICLLGHYGRCCMKYLTRTLHHTNWCSCPMQTRVLQKHLNDIFLMRSLSLYAPSHGKLQG